MLTAALDLARRGLPVFPLWGAVQTRAGKRHVCGCGSAHIQDNNAAKHPYGRLAPNGLSDASTDEPRIREWWLSAPNGNIGLATGAVVVLDVDPRHGGDNSLRGLEERLGSLPLTWHVLTGGGGEHIYFRAPEDVEIRNSSSKVGPGLDIRGRGGYVVAPPSIHISGRRYAWSVDHHPDKVALAEFPASLVTTTASIKQSTAPAEWRELVSAQTGEGARNQTLARLAGHLLRRYVDPFVVLELCQLWNQERCCPPLSHDELVRTVNSICKRELARRKAAA